MKTDETIGDLAKKEPMKLTGADTKADIAKKMADANETIDLGKIQEGTNTVKEEDIGTRRLLDGFKKLNIKLNFITEDITRIFKKSKYENLFDTAVLSVNTNEFLTSDDGMKVFKEGAKVHVETCDTLVCFKKEQR